MTRWIGPLEFYILNGSDAEYVAELKDGRRVEYSEFIDRGRSSKRPDNAAIMASAMPDKVKTIRPING